MENHCRFSNNTNAYLEEFQCIFREMTEKMSAAALTQSISGSFIVQMIPHHRAAIKMSENLLRYTTNLPLQSIALNIISSQKKSIDDMTAVCARCQSKCNTTQELEAYRNKNECIIKNMFREMKHACSDNSIDANFMREMIPHHRGAVDMSENALCYPLCAELVPLLKAIVISQKKGIRQMQTLLCKINGCQ